MATSILQKDLAAVVGDGALALDGQLPLYAVDGVTPGAVVSPGSVEEAQRVVRLAGDCRGSLVPRGGGTAIAAGMPPARLDIVVGTRRMNQLTLHEPADLVAGAEAGLTLAALNEELAKHGQILPLDAPNPSLATLGGVLSANTTGPRRAFYGTARDRVIGLKVVDPSGALIKGGGRVVKNVAGYDLPKLFIGAHGTLGLIVEATFKLASLPKDRTTLVGAFTKVGGALETARDIVGSGLRTSAFDLLNGTAYRVGAKRAQMPSISDRDYFIVVELTGVPGAVARQKMQVHRVITEAGGKSLDMDDPVQQEEFWGAIVDMGRTTQRSAAMATRFSCRWEGIEKLFLGHEAQAESNEMDVALEMYLGVGVGRAAWWVQQGVVPDDVKLAAVVVTLRKAGEIAGGPFVVEAAPTGVKGIVDVWGATRTDFEIMRRLKRRFDPNAVMSPGRFLGGI